jgi:hypothetical protein
MCGGGVCALLIRFNAMMSVLRVDKGENGGVVGGGDRVGWGEKG